MATLASHNTSNASVKRILREIKQLQQDPPTEFAAGPLEDNLFDWHCTLRGPKDTEFEGGLYHVRVTFPPTYPFRPPSLRVLTPSGRFETDTPICISFTNYHEELWQPAWGIQTAIIGLQGFFSQSGTNAMGVGALNSPTLERKRLATLSRDWTCPQCKERNLALLPDLVETTKPTATVNEGSERTHQVSETTRSTILSSSNTAPSSHIALPTFQSPTVQGVENGSMTGPPRALNAPSTPGRNIPFIGMGSNPVPLSDPADGRATPSAHTPARPEDREGGAMGQLVEQGQQQLQVQAFPAFRGSDVEGVPRWLDSAILILSVLLGGIMIHRVMF